MVFSVGITYSDIERIEDEARMQELHDLFLLLDKEKVSDVKNRFNVFPGLEELRTLERVIESIIKQTDVKAEFKLITQLINRQKLDETE
ncbi:hypothetical protein [Acinetobacter sp. ANC 4193]